MKVILFYLLLAANAVGQVRPTPYVEPTRVLREKGSQIGVYADYFKTSSYVDKDGKKASLPDGFSFQRAQIEIAGFYGATNHLQLGGGFRFRENDAVSKSADGKQVAAAAGLQSTFANIMYAFSRVNSLQYTLEGTFRYAPYSNKEFEEGDDITRLILGDEGNEVSAGLGVNYRARNNNFLSFRGGYRMPGTDLSHELYWQLEGALVWTNIALVAGVNGITSMKSDPYESNPEDKPNYNAQTNLYNSTNRELIAPYAGVNIALGNKWRVELRGSQSVSGNSTDLGTTIGLNVIRRSEQSSTRVFDRRFKTYDIEAAVTRISPKKEYVEIDKGIADDINKGMRIDFFEFDYVGGNVLIAAGVVVKSKSDKSIVKITQRYSRKKEIKQGTIGRTTLK